MAQFMQSLLMVSVMFLVLGVGLRTTIGQIVAVARQFLLLRGMLANFLIVPLAFYLGMLWLPLSLDVKIGIMIMAAAPIAHKNAAINGEHVEGLAESAPTRRLSCGETTQTIGRRILGDILATQERTLEIVTGLFGWWRIGQHRLLDRRRGLASCQQRWNRP